MARGEKYREARGASRKQTQPPIAAIGEPGTADSGSLPPVPDIKFSFLVITYADQISRYMEVSTCLQSIFDQTDHSFEVILLHDGPNDAMRALWQDAQRDYRYPYRIKYYEVPFRGERGGHALVDFGRMVAVGEFVTALNGDNLIRNTYVERMYHPDADIVTCQVLMKDLPGIIFSGRGFARGRIDRLNYAVKTGVARRVPHKMHIDADWDWLIDCWDEANSTRPVRVVHVDEILGVHR